MTTREYPNPTRKKQWLCAAGLHWNVTVNPGKRGDYDLVCERCGHVYPMFFDYAGY